MFCTLNWRSLSHTFCSTSPSPSYVNRFPVPRPSKQPPAVPLKAPHPVTNLVHMGIMKPAPVGQHVYRQHSLMVDDSSRLFKACGANSGDVGVSLEDGWVRMDVDVPVMLDLLNKSPKVAKRPTEEGPLFEVRHELRVRVTFGYDQVSSRSSRPVRLFDELVFTVPMKFVNVLPLGPSPHATSFFPVAAHMHSGRGPVRAAPCTRSPRASQKPSRPLMTLPPYNQLYYENGDRRDEMLGALPVYREKEDSSRVLQGSPTSQSSSGSSFDYPEGRPSRSNMHHGHFPSSYTSTRSPSPPPGLRGSSSRSAGRSLGDSFRNLRIGGRNRSEEEDERREYAGKRGLPPSMARYTSSGRRQ